MPSVQRSTKEKMQQQVSVERSSIEMSHRG
jgi:hypothetical protein